MRPAWGPSCWHWDDLSHIAVIPQCWSFLSCLSAVNGIHRGCSCLPQTFTPCTRLSSSSSLSCFNKVSERRCWDWDLTTGSHGSKALPWLFFWPNGAVLQQNQPTLQSRSHRSLPHRSFFTCLAGKRSQLEAGYTICSKQVKNHYTKIFSSNLSDICLGLDLRDRWKGTGKCLAMSFWKPRKSSSLSPSVHRVPPTSPLWPSLSCSILKWQHGPCCRCFSCSEMARDDIFPPEVSNTPSFHLHRKKHPRLHAEAGASPQWASVGLAHNSLWCSSGAVLVAPRISTTSPCYSPLGAL